MKSSRFLLCFLYWFFNQLQALVGEMTTRVAVKDCFYDGRLGHYSFPVNIGGISEIVSCLEECSCNGTAIGWQYKFNCEWCCCEIRLPFKEVVPNYTNYRIWGSITTIFMILFPLICYAINRKKIKRLERELAKANSELESHRIRQDNYGMVNGL